MKHYIYDPASGLILGESGAPVTGYEPGLTSERQFDGKPFSRLTVMATSTNGELATISIPGGVEGLTPQQVQSAVRTLNFIRVKFTGLTLEIKGGEYNKVTYTGTAERAEVVPAAPIPGKS